MGEINSPLTLTPLTLNWELGIWNCASIRPDKSGLLGDRALGCHSERNAVERRNPLQNEFGIRNWELALRHGSAPVCGMSFRNGGIARRDYLTAGVWSE